MKRQSILAILGTLALLILPPQFDPGGGGFGMQASAQGYGKPTTSAVPSYVTDLQASLVFCKSVAGAEYLVDCLSERIEWVAYQMPRQGEVSQIRAALLAASSQLETVATRHGAQGGARMSMGGARPMRTTRPLRPVPPERLSAALAAADAVVAQTELVLLRSSGAARENPLAFQQVAAVMNSTKVLLRSS